MSGTLKKRWSLPQTVITHIFDGEPKDNDNDFGGYHSEAVHQIDNVYAKIDGQPDPVMLQRRQTGKSYQFMIRLKKGGNWTSPGLCSFFPSPHFGANARTWDKPTLIRMIEQGLTDPKDSDRHSREAWTNDPRGIRTTGVVGAQELLKIRVNGISCHVKYSNGEVESVYPATFG